MAYYKLAKLHHPDVKGDEIRFKNINLAYEVLKNEVITEIEKMIQREQFLINKIKNG
jgi:DnaJ-class molecular chaperone